MAVAGDDRAAGPGSSSLLSGLATGASWLCYFRALKIGDAARVAPLDKMSIVLVAVFGVAFLGEKLSRSSTGSASRCAPPASRSSRSGDEQTYSAAVATAIASAIGSVNSRPIAACLSSTPASRSACQAIA